MLAGLIGFICCCFFGHPAFSVRALCTRYTSALCLLFIPLHLPFFAFENLHVNREPRPVEFPGILPPSPLVIVISPFFLVRSHGSCAHARTRRFVKEQKLYAQENQDQKMKLDKFVATNADEWDIKNAVRSYHPRTSRPKHRTCGPSFVLIRKADLV